MLTLVKTTWKRKTVVSGKGMAHLFHLIPWQRTLVRAHPHVEEGVVVVLVARGVTERLDEEGGVVVAVRRGRGEGAVGLVALHVHGEALGRVLAVGVARVVDLGRAHHVQSSAVNVHPALGHGAASFADEEAARHHRGATCRDVKPVVLDRHPTLRERESG